jgi:hypothetical protein
MLAELMSLYLALTIAFLMSLLTQVQVVPLSFYSRVLGLLLMVVSGLLLWLP